MGHHGATIEVDNLSRRFKRRRRDDFVAVDGISFTIEAGERVAFIGPNGAGKSTSIKMLTGLLWPSDGHARILGLTPWKDRKQLAYRIGTLFGQRSQLWPELPAVDSFHMLGAIFGLSKPHTSRRIDELGALLHASGLFGEPVRTLSLGQKMRCELVACLLHEPEILFLDEPTIGLDLLGKNLFRELVLDLNRELATTIFLTSHDVTDIEHVAARAIIINKGRIAFDNSVQRMQHDLLASKRIELHLPHPVGREDLDYFAQHGITASSPAPSTLILEVDTTQHEVSQILADAMARLSPTDIGVTDPPLEQIIGQLYEGEAR